METFSLFSLLVLTCAVHGAVETGVTNFRIVSVTESDATFSWEYSSGLNESINTVYLHYLSGRTTSPSSLGSYDTIASNTISKSGTTFSITRSLSDFLGYGQMLMWMRIIRGTSPTIIYSEQIYTELGNLVAIELKILLSSGETCLGAVNYASTTFVERMATELYRLFRLTGLPYDFVRLLVVRHQYAVCQVNEFVTFRALIDTSSSYRVVDLIQPFQQLLRNETVVKSFYNLDNNRLYPLAEGPCGLRIPSYYAPFCSVNTTSTSCSTIGAAPTVTRTATVSVTETSVSTRTSVITETAISAVISATTETVTAFSTETSISTETVTSTQAAGSITVSTTSTETSFSVHVVTVRNTEIRTSLFERTVTQVNTETATSISTSVSTATATDIRTTTKTDTATDIRTATKTEISTDIRTTTRTETETDIRTTTIANFTIGVPSAQTQQLASEGNDSYAATAVAATLGSIIIVMLVCIIGLLGYIIGTRKNDRKTDKVAYAASTDNDKLNFGGLTTNEEVDL